MQSVDRSSSRERLFDVVWLLSWIILSSIWCVTAARHTGATFDEPIYLEEGLNRWRSGSTAELMSLGTMPLPVDAETLPLYLWERWRGRPIDLATETHDVLPLARAANLIFWTMLLFYAWLIARRLAGRWAGRLTVALLACEPNFLAHASLATTDVCVTACVLAFVYHFRVNRAERWLWRVAWPSFWLAVATLAKTSGLVFAYLCIWTVDWEWRSRRRAELQHDGAILSEEDERRLSWKATFKDVFQMLCLAMIIVFVYCGSDFRTEPTFVEWARSLKAGPFASVMVWLSENLRIFSNAGEGLIKQFTHNVRGHGAYLLGETHRRALWYYFPVALSIKLALPILLLPAVLIGLRLGGARVGRWYCNWALLCGVVLFLFMVLCRVQIGIRLVLPAVALGIVGLSAAVVQAIRSVPTADWRARLCTASLCAGVLWMIAASVTIWPNGLCFVNTAWRRVDEDYHLVSEGNLDWGQGLKELKQWQRERSNRALSVWYYGKDPLIKQMPVREAPLHAMPFNDKKDFLDQMRGRTLAASITLVHGPTLSPEVDRIRRWLWEQKPKSRTSTFLIYDFGGDAETARFSAKDGTAPPR